MRNDGKSSEGRICANYSWHVCHKCVGRCLVSFITVELCNLTIQDVPFIVYMHW